MSAARLLANNFCWLSGMLMANCYLFHYLLAALLNEFLLIGERDEAFWT
jgi:hypothetical protein